MKAKSVGVCASTQKGESMRKKLTLATSLLAIMTIMIFYALPAFSTIQSASGFDAADGDMAAATTPLDWNSFGPLALSDWHGTAPYRTTTNGTTNLVSNGWTVIGLEDAQSSPTDTGFAGGTKEDADCPTAGGTNIPNKDDMKRVYLATKVGSDNHPYLMLAWTRIPLNTTQSSTHLAFEFNQAQAFDSTGGSSYQPCTTTPATGTGTGLVHRTVGDFLLLYDFGGSNTFPTIGIQRWVAKGDTCAVGSHTGKQACWGPETSPLPSTTAVAAVDEGNVTDKNGTVLQTYPTSTVDCLAPSNNCATTGTADALGLMEFGEAGIDLQAANVFTPGSCETFGTTSAVSRSSGDSGQAAMEDLVGPGHLNLTNCGEIKIIKRTDARGINHDFTYTTDIPSGSATGAATFSKTPATTGTTTTFTLNDNGNSTSDSSGNTEDITNVQAGTYHVTETVDTGWGLESLTCSPSSGTSSGTQDGTVPAKANITVAAGQTVTCTYVNQQLIGAIRIIKTGKYVGCSNTSYSKPYPAIPSPNAALGVCSATKTAQLAGAHFKVQLKTGTSYSDVTGATSLITGSDGTVCFSSADIIKGSTYGVTETSAPPGYSNDAGSAVTDVQITDIGTCSTGSQKEVSFTDTPLTNLTVTAAPQAGDSTKTSVACSPSPAPATTVGPTPRPTYSATDLTPKTYTCTVVVDP
jgi:prealbumin domain-containing protein